MGVLSKFQISGIDIISSQNDRHTTKKHPRKNLHDKVENV